MKKYITPAVRRWTYGICIAAVPVLVYFDVLEPEALPIIAPLLLAIFNVPSED